MGGIVGLTEICLKTNNLEIALFKQVGLSFFSQPQMGLTMTQLLNVYFESKEVAKAKKVIWNGSTQSYNEKPLSCKNKNDLNLINLFILVAIEISFYTWSFLSYKTNLSDWIVPKPQKGDIIPFLNMFYFLFFIIIYYSILT